MSIVAANEYLSFGRVARRYGKHSSTTFRWNKDGIAGVKLKATLIGGRWMTTEAWLQEFHAAVNAARGGEVPPETQPALPAPSPSKRAAAASAALASRGF